MGAGFEDTRIIAVTALPMYEVRERALDAGCEQVFAKPMDSARLERLLEETLRLHRRAGALQNPVQRRLHAFPLDAGRSISSRWLTIGHHRPRSLRLGSSTPDRIVVGGLQACGIGHGASHDAPAPDETASAISPTNSRAVGARLMCIK